MPRNGALSCDRIKTRFPLSKATVEIVVKFSEEGGAETLRRGNYPETATSKGFKLPVLRMHSKWTAVFE